jgi:D-serine dehydratase
MSNDETSAIANSTVGDDLLSRLRRGLPAVWIRGACGVAADELPLCESELMDATARLARYAPVLRRLFPAGGWDGRISSDLIDYPDGGDIAEGLLVKCDHALPMAGSVKARGGIYELLCHIEDVVRAHGLWTPRSPMETLLDGRSLAVLREQRVVVASTGNLGFSIGLVARRFGLQAEIHMSHEAKTWKKARLSAIGAEVVEHSCDYTETVARARQSAKAASAYFIDDEDSRRLFVGYATAGRELADQLAERGVEIGPDRPLIVYLPCGVGGAPGGITAGLKAIFGPNVIAVIVEPVASPCVFAALAAGGGRPISVYDLGLDNETVADGLAVPVASSLVMRSIGRNIDAAVAVTDASMVGWVRRAWREAGLRLEPSAASAFAAAKHFLSEPRHRIMFEGRAVTPVNVVWTTGGAYLPDEEFEALLGQP